MKKFIFFFLMLAASQVTFADEPAGRSISEGGLVVVADADSYRNGLFRVTYTAERTCDTRMIIKDADGNRIFTELIRNQCSFVRPYNFSQLPYGRYTIIATNPYSEKVTYVDHQPAPEVMVQHNVVKFKDGRYLLQIPKSVYNRVVITITTDEEYLYSQTLKTSGDYACMFTIKNLKDPASVRFEVKAVR